MGRATETAGWCILRTSGGRTLKLARSLADAGFDVWSPMQTATRRRGRTRERVEFDAPIMPTFVFARAAQLTDIIRALAAPSSRHPPFSIFRHAGRIPLIAEREIAHLRAEEAKWRDRAARAAAKASRHDFVAGQRVRVDQPAFAGLEGIVEEGGDQFALVAFNGAVRLKIATFLLRTDEVQSEHKIAA